MTNFLLALGVASFLAYGFWVMKRLEGFLNSGRIDDAAVKHTVGARFKTTGKGREPRRRIVTWHDNSDKSRWPFQHSGAH